MYIHACIHAWVVMGEMVLVLEEEDEEVVVVVVVVVRAWPASLEFQCSASMVIQRDCTRRYTT